MRLYGVSSHYRVVVADVDASELLPAFVHDAPLVEAILVDPDGSIPLPDDAVDVATSSDVFEHIAPAKRSRWASELSRVSRLGQIHVFPADSRDGRWASTAADRAFDAWHRARFGEAERWTAEHLAHDEPIVEDMVALFPGCHVQGFANTSVWLEMVKNLFGRGGFVDRARFSLRYLFSLRHRDRHPPFKACMLVVDTSGQGRSPSTTVRTADHDRKRRATTSAR